MGPNAACRLRRWASSSPARFPGSEKGATARPVRISRVLAVVLVLYVGSFAADQVRKLFHRVLRPTEAPPFMRGYSRADLPYEQPTNTDPDGECGSCWQDDIIINHFHYEPCYPTKNAVITIHKTIHHTVLSDGKTPHDFMAFSSNAALRTVTTGPAFDPPDIPTFTISSSV